MAASLVAPTSKLLCECSAVEVLPALVKRHNHRLIGNPRGDGVGLLGDPGRGVAGTAFWNLLNGKFPEAELTADLVEPLQISVGELPFRALLQSADRNDSDMH